LSSQHIYPKDQADPDNQCPDNCSSTVFTKTDTILNIPVFFDVPLCHWASSFQHFKGWQALHLLGLIDNEVECTTVLKNMGNHSPNNTAPHTIRLQLSKAINFHCKVTRVLTLILRSATVTFAREERLVILSRQVHVIVR